MIFPNDVKCPECTANSQSSTVNIIFNFRIANMIKFYYDSDGALHNHTPIMIPAHYKCSNDHTWSATVPNTCQCGWHN